MARSPRASKEEDDRLELVWAALTNPRRTIGSIQLVASEHGFHDVVTFNKAFRARYGSSPAEIRKAARKRRIRFGAPKH
jgi:transcriptional regulator GlxA family with amidase domain